MFVTSHQRRGMVCILYNATKKVGSHEPCGTQFDHEYYILLDVNDKLRIDFGVSMKGAPGSAQQDVTEQEFNEVRETLRQIVASLRFQ
jgi:hypothetical protein